MPHHPPEALAPGYLQQFQCIGPACPQTCCSGWGVPISKATWKKYQTIPLATLRSQLKKHVHRQPSGSAHYAMIGLKDDASCQFLDSDKLCGIQKAVGHGALSDICQTYPRKFQSLGGQWQVWASLSCPEIARLALGSPDALALQPMTLTQYATERQIPLAGRLDGKGLQEQAQQVAAAALRDRLQWLALDSGLDGLQALRLWILLVRQVATQQREWITGLESAGDATLEDALNRGLSGLADVLEGYAPGGTAPRLALVDSLPAMDPTERGGLLKQLSDIMDEAMVGGDAADDLRQASRACPVADLPAAEQRLRDFEAAHPWVLPHLMVSQMMEMGWYAFVMDADPLENALLMLVLRIALMRHWLAAWIGHTGGALSLDTAVRATHSLCRSFEHNPKFIHQILEALQDNQMRTLATAFALLGPIRA